MYLVTRAQQKMVCGTMSDLFPHVVHSVTGGLFSFLIKRDSSVPSGFDERDVFRQGLKGSFKEPHWVGLWRRAHDTGAIVIADDGGDDLFKFLMNQTKTEARIQRCLYFSFIYMSKPPSCLQAVQCSKKMTDHPSALPQIDPGWQRPR